MKIFENGRITRTSKSQNGTITRDQICPKRSFSQNFSDAFGAATDFRLERHYTSNLTIYNYYFRSFDIFEKIFMKMRRFFEN